MEAEEIIGQDDSSAARVTIAKLPEEGEIDRILAEHDKEHVVDQLTERLEKYAVRISRLRRALRECITATSLEESTSIDAVKEICNNALQQDDSDSFMTAHLAHSVVRPDIDADDPEEVTAYYDHLAEGLYDSLPSSNKISAKQMLVKSIQDIFQETELPEAAFEILGDMEEEEGR